MNFRLLAAAVVATASSSFALPLHEDTFTYPDGPLSGQGIWTRGVLEPAADTPSEYLRVEDGVVTFDWTASTTINNAVRVQWFEEGITTGVIYAAFDFRMSQAPVNSSTARPGFLSFDRSGGSQLRGHVGLRAGTQPGTFQLGASASSQTAVNFTYVNRDLEVGVTYRVMVGYDAATAQTRLWIGTDDPQAPHDLLVFGSTSTNVRRIQLRLSNTDGSGGGGITNMGIFHLDNLVVGTDPTPSVVQLPDDPSKVFLFLLAGQSNMAGRGEVAAEDRETDPRIVTFTADRQWRPARDPLHWDKLSTPNPSGVGPALSFARALLPHLPEGAVIGLIPTAQGNTTLTQWGKAYAGQSTFYGGQYLYPHAVGRALDAAQSGTLAGILWNHGEADAASAELDGGLAYREKLHQLIADLRADLGMPFLPFVGATLGPWREDATAVNNVYLNLPGAVPLTATVNTLDPEVAPLLFNNPDDTPHYLPASYRLLGQLYAEAMLPLLFAPPPPAEAPVLHLVRDGTALRLRWFQEAGRSGHVEVAPALTGPWQQVQTFQTEASCAEQEYSDLAWDSLEVRFYRVRIE